MQCSKYSIWGRVSSTYFGSRINFTRSPSSFINILLSLGVLFNVFLMKSSRSIPVESLYGVSTLESERNIIQENLCKTTTLNKTKN